MPYENEELAALAKDGTEDEDAAKKMIDRVLEVARRAGLKLEGIDVSTFALIRAFNGSIEDSAEGEQDGAVVYCHLGSVTSLAVAHGPACLFTRTLPYGTESMAEELAAKRQIPVEDARSWLTYVGLARELEAIDGDAEMIADARAVLEGGVGQLAGVIQASLDYYMSQTEARALTHTIICGPGTAIDGLSEALREHVPDSIDPRRPQIEGEGAGEVMPAQLALAYGSLLSALDIPLRSRIHAGLPDSRHPDLQGLIECPVGTGCGGGTGQRPPLCDLDHRLPGRDLPGGPLADPAPRNSPDLPRLRSVTWPAGDDRPSAPLCRRRRGRYRVWSCRSCSCP